MYLERTPNEIANSLVPDTIITKNLPDTDAVKSAVARLPVSGSLFTGVVGVGDYNHSRSQKGSCALGYGEKVVVKLSLGNHQDEVVSKSRNMMESIKNFESVSPQTMVIITQADDDIVKTVIIQKKIDGKPVCDVPIKELLSLKALYGMKNIVQLMNKWYLNNNCYDLCGQKSSKTILGKFLQFVPFMSDNLMIDNKSNVYLADNILDVTLKNKNGYAKYIPRRILNHFPIVFLNTLIVMKKTYNFLTRNTEEVIQNPAFT